MVFVARHVLKDIVPRRRLDLLGPGRAKAQLLKHILRPSYDKEFDFKLCCVLLFSAQSFNGKQHAGGVPSRS